MSVVVRGRNPFAAIFALRTAPRTLERKSAAPWDNPGVLSIDDARTAVLEAVSPLQAEDVPVSDASGRVLAEDVLATADVPGFDNSAMDGFAALPGPSDRVLDVIGESRAGTPFTGEVGPGEAIRISTGAAVPTTPETGVLQIELTAETASGGVRFNDELAAGRNIRRAGEDMLAGAVALPAGCLLGPAQIGVAISAGAASVRCARRPTVSIVNTGDELAPAGHALRRGQVHDSNGPTLAALARTGGAEVLSVAVAADSPAATRAAIEAALAADVVVLSGGVSVGPHDHVKPALEDLGVRELFWGLALKPGKPTWFGAQGERLVFGLPGNPVSAYVTFVLFVRPALRALQGADPIPRFAAKLATAIVRHAARDECVRVMLTDGLATPTGPQGSHVSSSLAAADGLAIIPRGEGTLPAGTEVEVEPL